MPVADQNLVDFDEPTVPPLPASLADEFAPTIQSKKSKKGKKTKKNAPSAKRKAEDDQDDTISNGVTVPFPGEAEPGFDNVDTVSVLKASENAFKSHLASWPSPSTVQTLEDVREQEHVDVAPEENLWEQFDSSAAAAPDESSDERVQQPSVAPTSVEPTSLVQYQRLSSQPIPSQTISSTASASPNGTVHSSPPVDSEVQHSKPAAFAPRLQPSLSPRSNAQLLPSNSQSQPQPRPHAVEAPPPHKLQSHFFSLPDLGLDLVSKQEQGKTAGSDGCCCCFDSFAEAGEPNAARRGKDVLLVGSDSGLDIYKVVSDKLEVLGRLEGLRGAVMAAKVLPQAQNQKQSPVMKPLVAVVIHGPALEGKESHLAAGLESNRIQQTRFRTTVEIYSVADQRHIATLYEGMAAPASLRPAHQALGPLRSQEDFLIDARGSFITLASGKSGEIWIFSNTARSAEFPVFRCLGKFWTALQTGQESARTQQGAEFGARDSDKRIRLPLFTLSDRWLAIVPPYTSSGAAIRGAATTIGDADPHLIGLTTSLAPIQPLVTCEVAGIDDEGTLSWLSRKAAQGLVKASQKGYEFGLQGWKELTNPSPIVNGTGPASRAGEMFPPTNAPADDPKRLANEPALVSIIDLRKLVDVSEQVPTQPLMPLATFALVEGCNHLSFSHDGTRLLTTNRKGEASTVWDLQFVAHGKSKISSVTNTGFERSPHIRQVHRITRSSPSVVVGSCWSQNGDRLALVTAHGTIHLHEVPPMIAERKRKRRQTADYGILEKAEPTVSVSHGMSPPSSNSFWNTVRSGMQSVGAQVTAIRTHSTGLPTTFAGFREATAAAGQAGGRAVAKGLSQGYSAAKGGASDIWHAEDNKIRQKALQDVTAGGNYIRWVHRRGEAFLAVVCGGIVYLYPIQQETRRKGNVEITGLRKFASRNFTLPRITIKESSNGCSDQGPHGFWALQPTVEPRLGIGGPGPVRSQASEVESNPPYCPFHVDPRISIYAFDDGPDASQVYDGIGLPWQLKGLGSESEAPWTFGEPLPPSSRMNDSTYSGTEQFDQLPHMTGLEDLTDQVESKLTIRSTGPGNEDKEQIRVHTKRARVRNIHSSRADFDLESTVEDAETE